MDTMIYIYGTGDGRYVKIGHTTGRLAKRKSTLTRGQLSRPDLRFLAAVRGSTSSETAVHEILADYRADVESTETFDAAPAVVEWVNWLRQQWWTWIDEDTGPDDVVDVAEWCPAPGRRVRCQQPDPSALIQDYEVRPGNLVGTPWQALSTPPPAYNDYYTPAWLVNLARDAMGGIDLDPASHHMANRVHKIPLYYHAHRRAEHNPWAGRVWLNPPYGGNAPWFELILKYRADITQLCMLSPVYVFSTKIARPVVDVSSAMVLLTPTPSFWGRKLPKNGKDAETCGPDEEPRFGTNHPHAVLYLGDHPGRFKLAFREVGIPMSVEPDDAVEAAGHLLQG